MSAASDLNLKVNVFWGERVLPHRRSLGKLEEKIARNYCHQHSVHAGYNTPDEIKEIVFVGTSDDVVEEVLSEVGNHRTGEIPDCPEGLVLHNSVGQGAFD